MFAWATHLCTRTRDGHCQTTVGTAALDSSRRAKRDRLHAPNGDHLHQTPTSNTLHRTPNQCATFRGLHLPLRGWHTLRACGCAWLTPRTALIFQALSSTALRACVSDDGAWCWTVAMRSAANRSVLLYRSKGSPPVGDGILDLLTRCPGGSDAGFGENAAK